MAKRKHRGDAPIQRGFDFSVVAAEPKVAAKPRRRRVKRVAQVTVEVRTLEMPELESAWYESNRADCRTLEYLARVSSIRLAMLTGTFGVPNDPPTFDYHGRLINGRKQVQAAKDLQFPLNGPVSHGVVPRDRFAIDDATPRNGPRKAMRRVHKPAERVPISLDKLAGADKAQIGSMLDLTDKVTGLFEEVAVERPSEVEAMASLSLARSVFAAARLPVHVMALLHLFACRHDAGKAPGDFMRALAEPSFAPSSSAALLARSGLRPSRIEDEADFLVTCIMAWGMFRAGKAGDPYSYRENLPFEIERAKVLETFLRVHQPVPVDAHAIRWTFESIGLDQIKELLAKSGFPVEGWSEEDKRTLTPLVTDAHHAKGLRSSGQAIKIRVDGTVEDGIGRLMASYIAETPLRTVVGRDFPIGWSSQLQQGGSQSYGHRNNSEGVTNPYDIASALKTIACYEADRRDIKIGLERHRIIHARYPTLMRFAVLARDIEKMVPAKVSAAALAVIATRSKRDCEAFYRDLLAATDGTLASDTSRRRVVLALQKALVGAQRETPDATQAEDEARRKAMNHAGEREQLMKFEWMLLAWNAWVRGREAPAFEEPTEDQFPDVAYPAGDGD